MAKFYRVQIGTIHLTSNSLVGGIPCKLQIPQASELIDSFSLNPIVANNGEVITQIFERSGGQRFDIQVNMMNKATWDSLKSLRDTALTNETSVRVIGTGDIGDFDINATPLAFRAESFQNSRIYNITLSFIKDSDYSE